MILQGGNAKLVGINRGRGDGPREIQKDSFLFPKITEHSSKERVCLRELYPSMKLSFEK